MDADTDATTPWLATAYIPGPTLHRAVTDHGPLPAETVAVLGAGLAEGLAAVHAQGIVHRDLKPANVLLAQEGPRLIDFGIARALDTTSHTHSSTVLGTAAFMSPEQAKAQKVGPASDVFSLGSVLAFAATGRSPFGEGPALAVLFRVVQEEPDLAGLPVPLAGLISACLAKDPAARPGLNEVLTALTAISSARARDGGRWLPDDLTETLARHTLALTRVETRQTRPSQREAVKPKIQRRPVEAPLPPEAVPSRAATRAAPESFELTTPGDRNITRAKNLPRAVSWPVIPPAIAGVILAVEQGNVGDGLQVFSFPFLHTPYGVAALIIFVIGLLSNRPWSGYDLLVVDENGLFVIDKRRLRLRAQSFSLTWESLSSVHVVADGGFFTTVVRFEPGRKPSRPRLRRHTTAEGIRTQGYEVARIPTTSLARATQLRQALERFGGNVYSAVPPGTQSTHEP
ncbi:serine/threonine protein kinase [Nocardiopsis sp. ARC36]